MGSCKKVSINTHFRLVNMGSVNRFLYQKLIFLAACFWVSVFTLFRTLFRLCKRTIFRIKWRTGSQPDNSNFTPNSTGKKAEHLIPEIDVTNDTEESGYVEESDSPKFTFKFQYQTYKEENEPVCSNSTTSTSTNKYEFSSAKNLNQFVEEPEALNLTVKELYTDSGDGSIGPISYVSKGLLSNEELVHEISQHGFVDIVGKEEQIQEFGLDTSIKESISRKGKAVEVNRKVLGDEDDLQNEGPSVSREELVAVAVDSDSDSDSITSSHEVFSRLVASSSDRFLLEKDVDDGFDRNSLSVVKKELDLDEEDLELDVNLQNLSSVYGHDDFNEEDSEVLEELREVEEPDTQQNLGNEDLESLSENDLHDGNYRKEELCCRKNGLGDPEKSNVQNSSGWDSDDTNRFDTLWEHQDFIEQLQMELRKARATGLPTISEEDESPKIMEDFKPWKIDEKFQQGDAMGELHKFYKSYRERMRKFDILNFQKMYAMGFLQSKDPFQSISGRKASVRGFSLLSQKFLLSKRRKSDPDLMMNFIRELHGDLETVYVGQMCLSWEILHWQYEKAIELWDSDHHSLRQYNEVAGEFQQFQVLLQRFVENESFEGPRVENYTRKRCSMRNLLQVPVIKEDNAKDRKAGRKGKEDDVITSDMLVEILEESIRIFWQFVRADKDAHELIQKGQKGTRIEPQDPSQLQLLAEVEASLLKKEKKLKEMLRSGNCILRKLRKQQEDSSDHVLYFFSQVDMKLVSRVLNMSKVTMEQLIWCHNKLSKINFVSRKIHVEPSFLLFPC
ncbi:hypothetical protein K2173_014268 [Erythroxylum novogranatense]|uniref:Ribosomal protein L34Ae n=1 Tax=Erythroxylum novogranatense TaxID=1862640 RepID=A0AAV8SE81_9ROSI|nr:hypothetical protein K2173_014268 [Erythroxylum novogranatense]